MKDKFCKAQKKVNYHETKLIKKCLVEYYSVFMLTLDTPDYVPEKYNEKIIHYIFVRMKKALRRACAGNREYQRELLKKEKAKWLAAMQAKAEKQNNNVEENGNGKEKEQTAP